jgi:hypothetical protein
MFSACGSIAIGAAKTLVAGGRRARQLVGDDLVHPRDLGCTSSRRPSPSSRRVLEPRAQHRQRRLQAVREVAQGVAVARQVLALALDEGVDVVGQRASSRG